MTGRPSNSVGSSATVGAAGAGGAPVRVGVSGPIQAGDSVVASTEGAGPALAPGTAEAESGKVTSPAQRGQRPRPPWGGGTRGWLHKGHTKAGMRSSGATREIEWGNYAEAEVKRKGKKLSLATRDKFGFQDLESLSIVQPWYHE